MSYPGKYIAPYTNAKPRDFINKLTDVKTVEDFYIATDSDFTNAFTRAAAANIPIFLPSPTYSINTSGGAINLGANSSLIGFGQSSTNITDHGAAGSTFKIPSGWGGIVSDLTLQQVDSGHKATSGALLDASGVTTGVCLIANVALNYGYNGLSLGGSTDGIVNNIVAAQNAHDGINIQQAGAASATWQIKSVFLATSGRHGLCLEGPATSLSDWINVQTQLNAGYGIAVLPGTGNKFGVRIYDAFIGDDVTGGIYMDPGGGTAPHCINNTYIEATGTFGIIQTNTCLNLEIANPRIVGCASGGISASGLTLGVIGGQILNNISQGILIPSSTISTARIIGCRIAPDGAGTQAVGINIGGASAPNGVTVAGCDFRGSPTAISGSGAWLQTNGNIT